VGDGIPISAVSATWAGGGGQRAEIAVRDFTIRITHLTLASVASAPKTVGSLFLVSDFSVRGYKTFLPECYASSTKRAVLLKWLLSAVSSSGGTCL